MNETCRLCLESPVESFQYMTAYSKELSLILPEVDANLTEGPIICVRCIELLLTAYNFKRNCLRIEEKLKQRFNQDVCAVVDDLRDDIESKEDLYDCVKEELYRIEGEEFKEDVEEESIDIQPQSHDRRYLCKFCGEGFDERHGYNKHLKTHTMLTYNCEICCLGFAVRTELSSHKKLKHAEHKCNACDRKFLYKAAFDKHMREHVSGKSHFECNICGIKKRMKFQLREHMRVHTGERPYKCKFCPKSFSQGSTLSTHIRTMHLADRPFICEICGKCYAVRGQCTSHMRSHAVNVEKKFVCNFCGRAFTIHSKLQQHMRRHTGEKPMVCHYCSKSFADKSDLNRHLLTHTGERRYECPICERKFGRKGNMDVHIKSCSRRHASDDQ